MYRVTTDHQVLEQVAALPIEALASYAELLVVLEVVPWNGDSAHKDNPDGAVRTHAFGRGGLVTYLGTERRSVRSCTFLYVILSVSEARATLPEVLDRVADGDEVTITRHGRPVAVLVRPDTLRTRRAEATIRQACQVGDLLAAAGQQSLAPAGLSAERAEELVRTVRDARDRS